MTDLETDLRVLLAKHRYQSSTGRGMRGLMQHHIDALVTDLLPFIRARMQAWPRVSPNELRLSLDEEDKP